MSGNLFLKTFEELAAIFSLKSQTKWLTALDTPTLFISLLEYFLGFKNSNLF